MTTIAIPATFEEWHTLVKAEVPSPAAHWVTLATKLHDKVQAMSPEALDEAFFNQVLDDADTEIYERGTALNALLAAFEEQPDPPEETEEDKALKAEIFTAFKEAFPGLSWSTKKQDAVLSTAVYQFNNWKAGRYMVTSAEEGVKQFTRRMRRAFPGVSFDDDSFIWWSLMVWLRQKVDGKSTLPRRKISTSSYDLQDLITRHREEMGVSRDVDTYTLGWAVAKYIQKYQQVESIPADLGEQYVARIVGNSSQKEAHDCADSVYEWFAEHYLGQIVTGGVEVTDIPTLEAALLAKGRETEQFQIDAIKYGLADTVDQVKEGEITKEKVVDTLRLNIRSYGYTRFTGGSKPRLVTMLEVVEAVRDTRLTAEEWKARYARFMIRLGAVAGRYGEAHGMCPTLEKATIELGHELTRFPKDRTVLFASDDLTVRVPVETWFTDPDQVKSKAQEKWRNMTPAERKAAVVEQNGVHVQWDQMRAK